MRKSYLIHMYVLLTQHQRVLKRQTPRTPHPRTTTSSGQRLLNVRATTYARDIDPADELPGSTRLQRCSRLRLGKKHVCTKALESLTQHIICLPADSGVLEVSWAGPTGDVIGSFDMMASGSHTLCLPFRSRVVSCPSCSIGVGRSSA